MSNWREIPLEFKLDKSGLDSEAIIRDHGLFTTGLVLVGLWLFVMVLGAWLDKREKESGRENLKD